MKQIHIPEECEKHKIPLKKSKHGTKFCPLCISPFFSRRSNKGKNK